MQHCIFWDLQQLPSVTETSAFPATPTLWSSRKDRLEDRMDVDQGFSPSTTDQEESMEIGSPLETSRTANRSALDISASSSSLCYDARRIKKEKADLRYDKYKSSGPSASNLNDSVNRSVLSNSRIQSGSCIVLDDDDSDCEVDDTIESPVKLPPSNLPNLHRNQPAKPRRSLVWIIITVALGFLLLLVYERHTCHGIKGSLNVTTLRQEFGEEIFGQDIAAQVVPTVLHNFMENSFKRTLVMSFHGWTGIGTLFIHLVLCHLLLPFAGKNFMSSIIAKNIQRKAVHTFVISHQFPHRYKRQ